MSWHSAFTALLILARLIVDQVDKMHDTPQDRKDRATKCIGSMRTIPVMGWSMIASASLVSPPFSQRACQKWPPSPLCKKSM